MKKIFWGLLVLLSLITLFFFWASSAQWPENKYDSIISYHTEESSPSDTLSIITYNIGYLSGMTNNQAVERAEELYLKNLSLAKELIAKHDPDLVAFQEIDFEADRTLDWNQFDSLAWAGQFHQGAYAVNWDKRYVPFPYWPPSTHFKSVVSGQGLLSKYPIAKNSFIKLAQPDAPFYYKAFYIDRLIQISLVEIGNRTLAVLNVHLEAFDVETRHQQGEYLKEVVKEYMQQYPTLLVGDFNANPINAKSNVKKETVMGLFFNMPELKEAIPMDQFLLNESDYYTYSSEKPYQRIDFIFYSTAHIEAIDEAVLKEAGQISDHLPVKFNFKFKN